MKIPVKYHDCNPPHVHIFMKNIFCECEGNSQSPRIRIYIVAKRMIQVFTGKAHDVLYQSRYQFCKYMHQRVAIRVPLSSFICDYHSTRVMFKKPLGDSKTSGTVQQYSSISISNSHIA